MKLIDYILVVSVILNFVLAVRYLRIRDVKKKLEDEKNDLIKKKEREE